MSLTSHDNASLFTANKIAEIEMAAEWLITLLLHVSETDRQSILSNLAVLGDDQDRASCTKKRSTTIQAIKSMEPSPGSTWTFPFSFELPEPSKMKPRSLVKRTLLKSQGKGKQWDYLRTKTANAFRNLSTVDFIGQPFLLRGCAELVRIGLQLKLEYRQNCRVRPLPWAALPPAPVPVPTRTMTDDDDNDDVDGAPVDEVSINGDNISPLSTPTGGGGGSGNETPMSTNSRKANGGRADEA